MNNSTALESFSLDRPGVESQLAAPVQFCIPNVDTDEFSLLKPKWRSEINLTLALLARVHDLKRRSQRDFTAMLQRLAVSYRHIRGLSAKTLERKYSTFIASGCDWRTLRKGYVPPVAQPEEFKQFIKGLIEQNHRSVATALSKLRDELWPEGVEIPGYGTWMDFFARTYPEQPQPKSFPRIWPDGWTVRNLRRYGPTRAEALVFQQGLGAAHGSLPSIRRDPSKLRPMEWIVIDDFQLDVMCTFRGDAERGLKPQIAYVGGLMASCVGTRKKLAWVLGPMTDRQEPQPDGSVKTIRSNIRPMDVQALLYQVFRDNGLPEYPVTIICERRTATIAPALELMFSSIYGGRIRVQRTAMIHNRTLTNGFVETGGTPWEKGWIESDFNYLWNRLADLPGYKGSNERLNAPADLAEKLRYAAKFLGQGDKKPNLPPEIIDELRLPFLSFEQLEMAFQFVCLRSEQRTNHRFLGFQAVTEFRWANPTLPAPAGIDPVGPNDFRALAILTPDQQKMMVPKERKESALERWERLTIEHPRARLSTKVLALFLLAPNKATYRNHAVSFTRDKVGYSYLDEVGLLADVEERTELLAYVDPNSPGSALITHLDGRQVGVLRMLGDSPAGVDVTDAEAMKAAREQRAALVNRVLQGVRSRPLHVAANDRLLEDRKHAEAVLAAYERETTSLPAAERVSLQLHDARAVQGSERAQAQRLRDKPVAAQSAGDAISDLLPD